MVHDGQLVVRHRVIMTADTSTRKVSLVDKSPLAFGAALIVFLISLWTGPISIPYLLAGAGLGLLLG